MHKLSRDSRLPQHRSLIYNLSKRWNFFFLLKLFGCRPSLHTKKKKMIFHLKSAICISFFYLVCVKSEMAPELGRNIRSQFLFDPKYTSLNHGSYGSIPKALVPVMQDLRLKSEVNPDRWLRREMFPELQKNKETLAELVHVDPQELVFVFNAMTGINTVARSLPLAAGDKVIYVSTTKPSRGKERKKHTVLV